MSQHYLLSAKARTLSLAKLLAFSDAEARAMFAHVRWGSKNEQVCPHCGVVREHYFRERQDRWRCRDCKEYFSVTSGTVFANAKLPLQKILGAIALYVNAVKGLSACQLMRDLDVQYKTALVLMHKVRESLWLKQDLTKFEGTVEVDGAYVHTYRRPKNKKAERKDRRLAENQNPEKCSVLVIRERGSEAGEGADRSRIVVIPSENSNDIVAAVRANVAPDATVVTDEANGFTELGIWFEHKVVPHNETYCTEDGTNQNQSESFIARFRRLLFGQIHKLKRKYLDVYAYEIAFREDTRRQDNGSIFARVLGACLRAKPSRDWSAYWQGNKRLHDSVVSFEAGRPVHRLYVAPVKAAKPEAGAVPA